MFQDKGMYLYIYIYTFGKTLQLHGSFPILIERFSFSWHAKNDLDKNESKKQFLNRRREREALFCYRGIKLIATDKFKYKFPLKFAKGAVKKKKKKKEET